MHTLFDYTDSLINQTNQRSDSQWTEMSRGGEGRMGRRVGFRCSGGGRSSVEKEQVERGSAGR